MNTKNRVGLKTRMGVIILRFTAVVLPVMIRCGMFAKKDKPAE